MIVVGFLSIFYVGNRGIKSNFFNFIILGLSKQINKFNYVYFRRIKVSFNIMIPVICINKKDSLFFNNLRNRKPGITRKSHAGDLNIIRYIFRYKSFLLSH